MAAELTSQPLFAPLQALLEDYLAPEQIRQIEQAFILADAAHHGQHRHSGEPYISHPIAVAQILASMRMDAESIMAGIMHDVIEDTGIKKSSLASEFGNEVAELVDGVSKLTQIQFESKAEAQAENFRKMLLAMVRDIRVIIVKLADRLHNMRTLDVLPAEKRHRIAQETLEIYAPIANRLGMHNLRIEFEDLGFAAMYPLRHRILHEAVIKARGNRREILSVIKQALKTALENRGLPASAVVGRQKHLFSIYKKMRDKKLPFNEIMDIYAFRIIVQDVDTCYRVLGIVHNLYKPLPERFKDYIAIPKANGYQSLHTTLFGPFGLPIEIQIRTAEMDNMADHGIAAHWLYKDGYNAATDAEFRAQKWLKQLLEMQQSAGNSLEFIENVKIDLFPDEVYVFTPKGKIMELPKGATAIDFAYAVHSDIGNHCVAIKIDRRLAPLSAPLVNGQTIEVITASDACPNADWLNFAVTGKARSNIRHFLKHQRRTASITLGQQLLANALASLLTPLDNVHPTRQQQVLCELELKDMDDLYESIGLGYHAPLAIARRLVGIAAAHLEQHDELPTAYFSIRGTEGMVVNFAECCRPIPGDAITGLLQEGHGMIIHRAHCQDIEALPHPEKLVPVCWEENIQTEFKAEIRVELINQRGILAKLATATASAEADIENIQVIDNDGHYTILLLTLLVRDRVHLARVISRIRALKLVTRISRKQWDTHHGHTH